VLRLKRARLPSKPGNEKTIPRLSVRQFKPSTIEVINEANKSSIQRVVKRVVK
jgi:hypothetical protein